jgi:hypothetical protein
MKIEKLPPDPGFDAEAIKEFERLLEQPSENQLRPCESCDIPCPCCGSTSCACACTITCPQAPRTLSTDPEEHPIEEGIVPLVYALSTLRVVQPCWSCEGHNSPDGELYRPPSVWLYARSVFYPWLISEYLADLDNRGAIENPWHLCLVFFDPDNSDPTFVIEPDLGSIKKPELGSLQRDVRVIAEGLEAGIKGRARKSLVRIKNRSASPPCRPGVGGMKIRAGPASVS